MVEYNMSDMKEKLHALLKEHRALDQRIKDLEIEPRPNEIELRRLKKQKLFI